MNNDTSANRLKIAKIYWNDAPKECWENTQVLSLVYEGGMEAIMGKKFNNFEFEYKGMPLWVMGLGNFDLATAH